MNPSQTIIQTYIDTCLKLAEEYYAYLHYVPFYEDEVVSDMQITDIQDNFDDHHLNAFDDLPDEITLTQTDPIDNHKERCVFPKATSDDTFWQAIDNHISKQQINELEQQLNIILPISYKNYLSYKHHYKIFWDIRVVLYEKPKNDWDSMLINKNQDGWEMVSNKDYFFIGQYSDWGEIAIKLGQTENDELEVVLFDHETAQIDRVLADSFTEFLQKILLLDKPKVK